jgi:hypothetical protein
VHPRWGFLREIAAPRVLHELDEVTLAAHAQLQRIERLDLLQLIDPEIAVPRW